MKKLLVLTLVLGVASLASAGLKLAGIPTGPVSPSDVIRVAVISDEPIEAGFAGGVAIVVDGGPGSWTGNWGAPGMPDPAGEGNEVVYYGDVSDDFGLPWDVFMMDLTVPSTQLRPAQEWFWADVQFAGPGVVNIILVDYDLNVNEEAAINVIPEPASMLLLGLGGLLLRRK